jgi:ribosomal protein S26
MPPTEDETTECHACGEFVPKNTITTIPPPENLTEFEPWTEFCPECAAHYGLVKEVPHE